MFASTDNASPANIAMHFSLNLPVFLRHAGWLMSEPEVSLVSSAMNDGLCQRERDWSKDA